MYLLLERKERGECQLEPGKRFCGEKKVRKRKRDARGAAERDATAAAAENERPQQEPENGSEGIRYRPKPLFICSYDDIYEYSEEPIKKHTSQKVKTHLPRNSLPQRSVRVTFKGHARPCMCYCYFSCCSASRSNLCWDIQDVTKFQLMKLIQITKGQRAVYRSPEGQVKMDFFCLTVFFFSFLVIHSKSNSPFLSLS